MYDNSFAMQDAVHLEGLGAISSPSKMTDEALIQAARKNLTSACENRWWVRTKNGPASRTDMKGDGYLNYYGPDSALLAFDVANVQKLAGLPVTGVVDKATGNLIVALQDPAFRNSWVGKWAYTNFTDRVGREKWSEPDSAKACNLTFGRFETKFRRAEGAGTANKAFNASKGSQRPVYTEAALIAQSAILNFKFALQDIWWTNPVVYKDPSDPKLVRDLIKYNRVVGSNRDKGLATTEQMRILRAHVTANTDIGSKIRGDFVFVKGSNVLPGKVFQQHFVVGGKPDFRQSNIGVTDHYITLAIKEVNNIPVVAKRQADAAKKLTADAKAAKDAASAADKAKRDKAKRDAVEAGKTSYSAIEISDIYTQGVALLKRTISLPRRVEYFLGLIDRYVASVPKKVTVAGIKVFPEAGKVTEYLRNELFKLRPDLKNGSGGAINKSNKDAGAAPLLAKLKQLADAQRAAAVQAAAAVVAAPATPDAPAAQEQAAQEQAAQEQAAQTVQASNDAVAAVEAATVAVANGEITPEDAVQKASEAVSTVVAPETVKEAIEDVAVVTEAASPNAAVAINTVTEAAKAGAVRSLVGGGLVVIGVLAALIYGVTRK